MKCFDLDEQRSGEICNACVLLVKRFSKLPKDSNRNWHHVVDARSGPGIKSLVKSKGKKIRAPVESETPDTPEKILKRKHVYKRKKPLPIRQRHPSIAVSDFLNMSYWKRETVCCGTIFIGPQGEVAIDSRYFKPCKGGCNKKDEEKQTMELEVDSDSTSSSYPEEDDFAAAAKKLADDCAAASPGGDLDEGFFDKPGPSPMSGYSNTPPPSEVLEAMDATDQDSRTPVAGT